MRLHLDLACVKLANTETKLNETQVKLNETEEKLEATRKVVEKLDTRIFTWRINNVSVFLRQARTGESNKMKESVPFYTDSTKNYGYKLKVRIYFGKISSHDNHLVVSVAVMKGEYDALLPWPIKNKVTVSLIDQQEDPVKQVNIAGVIIPDFKPEAFARPVEKENEGFRCFFISEEDLHFRRYLVEDTLFLQVKISPL